MLNSSIVVSNGNGNKKPVGKELPVCTLLDANHKLLSENKHEENLFIAMLMSNPKEHLALALNKVHPYDMTQRYVMFAYQAILDTVKANSEPRKTPNEVVNLTSVARTMSKWQQLTMDFDQCYEFLHALCAVQYQFTDFLSICNAINNHAEAIRAIAIMQENISTIAQDPSQLADIRTKLLTQMVRNGGKTLGGKRPDDLIKAHFADITQLDNYIDSGDELLGSLARKELTMLAGNAGRGKSTYILGLIKDICTANLNRVADDGRKFGVVFVSYEMTDVAVMNSFVAMLSGLKRSDIKRFHKLSDADQQKVKQAYKTVNTWNINVLSGHDLKQQTVGEILFQINMLATEYDIGFVAIDGLWRMRNYGDKYQSYTRHLQELRDLIAIPHNCAIWILHQYKNAGRSLSDDEFPTAEHLDGGNMVARELDAIEGIKRRNQQPTIIHSIKSRNVEEREYLEYYYSFSHSRYFPQPQYENDKSEQPVIATPPPTNIQQIDFMDVGEGKTNDNS